MIFFVSIFLILFFILAKKRIDLAVLLIITALPAYLVRFKFLGIPFTLLEAMILVAFFVWLVFNTNFKDFLKGKYGIKNYLAEKKKRIPYPFGAEIILLLAISFVAVGVAGFSNEALGIWKAYFFEPILLFILILNVFSFSPVISILSERKADVISTPSESEEEKSLVGFKIFKRFFFPWGQDCNRGKKGVEKIIFSLAIGALIVSAYAIFQKITGLGIANNFWASAETRRVVSFFGYPNAVGLYLAPIIMVLFGYLLSLRGVTATCPRDSRRAKQSCYKITESIFLAIVIIAGVLAVYFAKSEGALVALLVALIAFAFLAGKRWRIATICLIIIAGAIVFLSPNLKNYTIRKITLMDFSGQVRRSQWSETWQMLKDGKIISGAGLANYQKAVAPYHVEGIFYDDGSDPEFHRHVVWNEEYKKRAWRPVEIYLYPHNIVLNFWTELGLFGLLLFVWIFLKTIYRLLVIIYHLSIKKNKQRLFLVLGILGAIIVIVVHGLVDVPYFKNDLACLFWILMAILSLFYLETKKENIK